MDPEQQQNPQSPDQAVEPQDGSRGEVPAGQSSAPEGETAAAPGKTRKARIHGKSQDRIRQDMFDDMSIDEAIRESIRLHGV